MKQNRAQALYEAVGPPPPRKLANYESLLKIWALVKGQVAEG